MSFYKTAKKLNTILKMYKIAVSEVYDISGTGRTIDTISKSVLKFLEDHPEIDPVNFQLRVAKIAQDKFNKLIVPYSDIAEIKEDFSDLKGRLINKSNQDDLQFFLHDLLHEILSSGSIGKFKKLDEEFSQRQEETLDLMKEDESFEGDWYEEDGEEYFGKRPRYESWHEVYSLEDFIEEQVAEALTNKNKITDNGLIKYVKTTLIGELNSEFEEHYSQEDFEFNPIYGRGMYKFEGFLNKILKKVSKNVAGVSNIKYKTLANKFLNSFEQWIKEAEQESKESSEQDDMINVTKIVDKLLTNTRNWVGAYFNIRDLKFKIDKTQPDEFIENRIGEKPISNLTDDLKMSLARRWVLSLDLAVKELMQRESGKQLKLFQFLANNRTLF